MLIDAVDGIREGGGAIRWDTARRLIIARCDLYQYPVL